MERWQPWAKEGQECTPSHTPSHTNATDTTTTGDGCGRERSGRCPYAHRLLLPPGCPLPTHTTPPARLLPNPTRPTPLLPTELKGEDKKPDKGARGIRQDCTRRWQRRRQQQRAAGAAAAAVHVQLIDLMLVVFWLSPPDSRERKGGGEDRIGGGADRKRQLRCVPSCREYCRAPATRRARLCLYASLPLSTTCVAVCVNCVCVYGIVCVGVYVWVC